MAVSLQRFRECSIPDLLLSLFVQGATRGEVTSIVKNTNPKSDEVIGFAILVETQNSPPQRVRP